MPPTEGFVCATFSFFAFLFFAFYICRRCWQDDSLCKYSQGSSSKARKVKGRWSVSTREGRTVAWTWICDNFHGTCRNHHGDFHACKHTTLLLSLFRFIFLTSPLCVTLLLSYLKTAPTRSTLTPRDLPIHIPEHTYDIEELHGERADVLAELIAWREQHSRYLLFGKQKSAARM